MHVAAPFPHVSNMCCRDMYNFLQAFMKGHPQFAHLPFFAVGESYAGHYIPAVTHKVAEGSGMLELKLCFGTSAATLALAKKP